MTTKDRCLAGAIVLSSLSLYFFIRAVHVLTIVRESIAVVYELLNFYHLAGAAFFCLLTLIFVDMSRLNPPDDVSIIAAFKMYMMYRSLGIMGWWFIRRLRKDRMNIEKSQSKLLLSILKRLTNTAYGRENDIGQFKTTAEFRSNHPLTVYAHYQPWVDRIVQGEQEVLIPEVVDFICVTSGTTSGKSKMFPKNTKRTGRRYMQFFGTYFGMVGNTPGASDIKYMLDFRFTAKCTQIGDGIRKGPGTAMSVHDIPYINHIPFAAKKISDMKVAFYVNLVFALRIREIGQIGFMFGSHAYAFFCFLEENWQQICDDIRVGRIRDSVVIEEEGVMETLNEALSPDPVRAEQLTREFAKGFQDIIPRIWPHAAYILGIFTGPFAVYKKVIATRYAGSIPIRCNPHLGSESVYGMNIWTNVDRYDEFLAYHPANFFEFIAEKDIPENQPPTLLLHELEIGERYEIVITTDEGMYRYRTNDVIAITGFDGQIPVYKFAQRADDNLSVFAEKTPVCVVSEVLEGCFSDWSQELVDYTVTEGINVNRDNADMCYVIMADIVGEDVTPEQIQQVDSQLQDASDRYRHYRHMDQIGPLHIIQVRSGAFEELREYTLSCNPDASSIQVKVPRKMVREDHIALMLKE